METRLMELELRYMELRRVVDELSGVMAEQQKAIDRLTAQLATATARLRDLGEQSGEAIGDEKPPHY